MKKLIILFLLIPILGFSQTGVTKSRSVAGGLLPSDIYWTKTGTAVHLKLVTNNVSIGSTSASYKLHVVGTAATTGHTYLGISPSASNVGIGTTTAGFKFDVWGKTGLRVVSAGATDSVLILDNFEVKKRYLDFTALGTALQPTDTTTFLATKTDILWDTTSNIIHQQNVALNVSIGSTTSPYKLYVVGTMGTTSHTYLASSASANVGIGTGTPGYKLDVWGKTGLRVVSTGATDSVLIIDGFEVKKRYLDFSAAGAALQWSDTSNQLATDYDISGFLSGTQVRSDINDTADILRSEWVGDIGDTLSVARGDWRGDIHDSLASNSQGFLTDALQWSDTTGKLATDYDVSLKEDKQIPMLSSYAFADSSVTINCTTDVWVRVTNETNNLFISKEAEGFTNSGDTIVATAACDYASVFYEVSADLTNGDTYKFAIFKNGTTRIGCAEIQGINSTQIAASKCITSVAIGDKFELKVMNDTDNDNPIIKCGRIIIIKEF